MKKIWLALLCMFALSISSLAYADVPDPSGRPRPRPRPYPISEERGPGINILRQSLYSSYEGLEDNEVMLGITHICNNRTTFEFLLEDENGRELDSGKVPSGNGALSELNLKLPKPAEGTSAIYIFRYTSWEDKIKTNFGLKNTDKRLEETTGGFKVRLLKNSDGYDMKILPL